MNQKKLIGQTKSHSFYETMVNVVIGWVIAISAQLLIFPLYDINIPIEHNLQISVIMTVISVIRQYVLRRTFNKKTITQY